MITKKYKRISLLLFVSMLFSLLLVNTFNVSASSNSVNTPTLAESMKYSEFFNELTTFINEKVSNNTGKDALTNYLKDSNFEKAIAEREFIKKAGASTIEEYSKAFNVWFEIFTKDPDSHSGYELKLAIASAMKFGNGVPKWYTKRTLVTPYERYEYYKVREAEGKFPISMKTRSVWEIRNTIKAL